MSSRIELLICALKQVINDPKANPVFKTGLSRINDIRYVKSETKYFYFILWTTTKLPLKTGCIRFHKREILEKWIRCESCLHLSRLCFCYAQKRVWIRCSPEIGNSWHSCHKILLSSACTGSEIFTKTLQDILSVCVKIVYSFSGQYLNHWLFQEFCESIDPLQTIFL